MKLVFAGLGTMGAPMAAHLIKAGHDVVGYNRSYDKARHWADMNNGPIAETLANACLEADALILCVGNDLDVEACVTQGIHNLNPSALVIDHTTTSAKTAIDMACLCKEKGHYFVDAPVSGGQLGAQNGQLSVMWGGDEIVTDRLTSIITAYSAAITHMGPSGSGQLTKMVNQIAICGVLAGLSEAVHFAKAAGLDPDTVLSAIKGGAAGSWQMNNRWSTMAKDSYDFGFAVDLMRKDLGLTLDEAGRNGAQLDLVKRIDEAYEQVQAHGGGRFDTSSLKLLLKP
jgi:3-hydroxyisobutyrate dehydrogenase